MKVYHYAAFCPDRNGNGGKKRAFQINQLLNQLGFHVIPFELSQFKLGSRFIKILRLFTNYKLIKKLDLPDLKFNQYRLLSNYIYYTKLQLPPNIETTTLFYEHGGTTNWLAPLVTIEIFDNIIVVPHNLESLVPNQGLRYEFLSQKQNYALEMAIYKNADLVLPISKEEEWFMRLNGINAYYYPYLPDETEVKELKNIGVHRQKITDNNQLLIMGSAGNPPTKGGMLNLLTFLSAKDFKNYKIHVAGYGTNTINIEKFPNNFKFHGPIPLDKLYQLYKIVDAAIIDQLPSTGALTKIPELLTAGIPVIANNNASRNYYNQPNISIFRTYSQLQDIILKRTYHSDKVNFNHEMDYSYVNDLILKHTKEIH